MRVGQVSIGYHYVEGRSQRNDGAGGASEGRLDDEPVPSQPPSRPETQGRQGMGAIVLLHGLNSHSGTWRKNIQYLNHHTGAPIVAPSLPTHHGGAISDATIETYAGYLSLLLSGLGITRAALVGNSMGGWLAMRLASPSATFPLSISHLILEDTAGVGSQDARAIAAGGGSTSERFPVLIVWGGADEISPLRDARRLNAMIPRSRLEVFEGIGHVPHWDAPDEFNRLLWEFLSGSH